MFGITTKISTKEAIEVIAEVWEIVKKDNEYWKHYPKEELIGALKKRICSRHRPFTDTEIFFKKEAFFLLEKWKKENLTVTYVLQNIEKDLFHLKTRFNNLQTVFLV